MEYSVLNTGAKMPMIGLGVYLIKDEEECKNAVLNAIRAGYRLIDTAAYYENEEAVGKAVREAVREGIVKREELFITSKIWVQDLSDDGARYAVDSSLSKLDLGYIDLYLIHQAMGDYFSAYRVLEENYKSGVLKAIGVSNFYPWTLTNFCETVEIIPAVNQIELHPFLAQPLALETAAYYGVVPQAWGPLAEGKHGIFTDSSLVAIGEKYGKSAAQVVLRWNAQRGVSIIPKSVHVNRMEQNIDIWDFTLTDEEMATVAAKDLGHSEIVDHSDINFVNYILGVAV